MTPELRALPSSFSDSCGISPSFAASVSGTSSPPFLPRLDTGFSTGLPALVAQCFRRFPSPSLRPVFSAYFPTNATQVQFLSPYARVSHQLLTCSPLPCVRFVQFIRRCLCVHKTLQLFPDLLSDLGFTASVSRLGFVARDWRRSAPHTTPPERPLST